MTISTRNLVEQFIILCILLLVVQSGITEKESIQTDYLIGPEDQLSITVWQNQDLSTEVTVGPDGYISYPLIGRIKLSGLTSSQAQKLLTESLKKYFVDPKVNVNITTYNSTRVKILGMVNSPGVYTLRGKNTLVYGIAQAGGTNTNAQLRYVTLLRGPNKLMEIDLYKILYEGKVDLDVPLESNDVIFVPDNRNTRVFVLGYVNQPGLIDINHRLTVLEAIMEAGGYTEGAKLSDVWVIRGNIEKPETLHFNLEKQIKKGIPPKDQDLKPGDIVFVHRGIVAQINNIMDLLTPVLRTITLGDNAYKAITGQSGGTNVSIPIE